MAVGVDETWNDDRVRGVDHLRLRGCPQLGGHGRDLLSLDQDIAFHEVANFRVHTDHGAALQKDPLGWRDALPPAAIQRSSVVDIACVRRSLRGNHYGGGKRRACSNKPSSGKTHAFMIHDVLQ